MDNDNSLYDTLCDISKKARNYGLLATSLLGIDNLTEKARQQYNVLEESVRRLVSTSKENMDELLQSAAKDPKLNDLARTVYDSASKGIDTVTENLEQKYVEYDSYLNEQVVENPGQVGFWDGFVSAYLATDCDRSNVEEYKASVPVGKAVGYVTSFAVPAKIGVATTIVTRFPEAWQVAREFKDKVLKKKPRHSDNPPDDE